MFRETNSFLILQNSRLYILNFILCYKLIGQLFYMFPLLGLEIRFYWSMIGKKHLIFKNLNFIVLTLSLVYRWGN